MLNLMEIAAVLFLLTGVFVKGVNIIRERPACADEATTFCSQGRCRSGYAR